MYRIHTKDPRDLMEYKVGLCSNIQTFITPFIFMSGEESKTADPFVVMQLLSRFRQSKVFRLSKVSKGREEEACMCVRFLGNIRVFSDEGT